MDITVFLQDQTQRERILQHNPFYIAPPAINVPEAFALKTVMGVPYKAGMHRSSNISFLPSLTEMSVSPELVIAIEQKQPLFASIVSNDIFASNRAKKLLVTDRIEAADSINETCYFLPFLDYCITYMRLPKQGAQHPLFFTDRLSGCQVFVDETPSDYVVYHANSNIVSERLKKATGINEADRVEMSIEYMKRMYLAAHEKVAPNGVLVGSLLKGDYLATIGIPGTKSDKVRTTFYESAIAQRFSYSKYKFMEKISQTDTTVFGVYSVAAGGWRFYYHVTADMHYRAFVLHRRGASKVKVLLACAPLPLSYDGKTVIT